MRRLLLVATITVLTTTAHAEPTRGLVLASATTAPVDSPAAQQQTAATPAAQPTTQQPSPPLQQNSGQPSQAPAKPDKAQMILEQLIKHGVIKPPPGQVAPAAPPASAPAPAANAPSPTTTPVQSAPVAPVAAAAAAPATIEKSNKTSSTESRIRAELRRHGIR